MSFRWIKVFITGAAIYLVVPVGAQMQETTQTLAAINVTTAPVAEAEVTTGAISSVSSASQTQVMEADPSAPEVNATSGTETSAAAEITSVTLPEGVIYQVIRAGSGAVATTTQTMRLHYTLYLVSGKMVESSREVELPKPLSLKLGQGDFIKGFELGVDGMRIGETRRIFVPSELAYGDAGHGGVPGNTDLIFEVELVDVK